jgi:hypothetical protein
LRSQAGRGNQPKCIALVTQKALAKAVKSASEQLKEGSETMKVNVYAGRGNWFALTDKRVAALPPDRGPWELMSTVNMKRGEMEPRLGVVTEEVLETIEAGQVYFVERPISVDVTRTSRG